MLYHPLLIGLTKISGNVFLAPIAGYSDAAFRAVCLDWGASLCFTEMVSAEALARDNVKTLRLLDRAPHEKEVAFQIFASSPLSAAEAVHRIAPLSPVLIDLNCGCSVPKVLKTGCGAALLTKPALIGRIVKAMAGETSIPVSVKLRSGWDASADTYMACAEEALRAGASLLSLHPRTRSQGFSGKAKWEHIRELKRTVPVPVLGSGDLFTPEDCRSMIEQTGCDGVMLARGAMGNPFLFRRVRDFLEGHAEDRPISPADRLSTALKHLELLIGIKGEKTACREMRKHFVSYTKGLHGGAALRQEAVRASRAADYKRIVEEYLSARRDSGAAGSQE
jgi:tRNA-dihydrouridine synthase B